MDGFLYQLVASHTMYDDYNAKFFGQYVDVDELSSLLAVSNSYSGIINLLNKRHNKYENTLLQKSDEELSTLIEKINTIKATQIDLCNNKLANDSLRKTVFQADEIDFDKVRKLVSLDSRIDTMLVENDSKLEIICNDEKIENENHKKLVENREALDTNIESNMGILNGLCSELDGKSVDIFKGLNIDTLREEYEQGLVGVIQNTTVRKACVSYAFDSLKRENRNLSQTYATAQQFVAKAKRENGFDVSELVGRNDQIMLNNGIRHIVHNGVRGIAAMLGDATDDDKTVTAAANGYLTMQPFVDGMYDYISNISTYSQDYSKGGTDYDKLLNFNNQLQAKLAELQDKDSRKFMNIVGKGHTISTERLPYEFVTNIFDNFNENIGNMRTQIFDAKQTTMGNEQQTEQQNSMYKGNDMTMSKQSTDEKQGMFTANIIDTSHSLVQDVGFEINEMGENISLQGKSR